MSNGHGLGDIIVQSLSDAPQAATLARRPVKVPATIGWPKIGTGWPGAEWLKS
jgi:hypothetical protein